MHSRSIGNFTDKPIVLEIEDQNMGASGDIKAAGGRIHRQVIPSLLPFEFNPLDDVVPGIARVRKGGEDYTEK